MYFDKNSSFIIFHGQDSQVLACQRACGNQGLCTFSICQPCYLKREEETGGTRHNRSRRKLTDTVPTDDEVGEYKGSKTPQSLRAVSCHHSTRNLQYLRDQLHWSCKPDMIGTLDWFHRPAGCRDCGKMYIVLPKGAKEPPQDWSFPTFEQMNKTVAEMYKSKVSTQLQM